jgi:transposase
MTLSIRSVQPAVPVPAASLAAPPAGLPVVVGVDTHQLTHCAAALDATGRLLESAQFPATGAGYRQLWRWATALSPAGVAAIGVESTGSYGAGLTQFLLTTDTRCWSQGIDIREVIRPEKTVRALRGKSDPIDAEPAARAVLAGTATARPKIKTGLVEAIRTITVTRDSAVKERTACESQLRDLITTAPQSLRDELLPLTTRARVARAARLRPDPAALADPAQAAKYALRVLARRIQALHTEIGAADKALTPLLKTAAPRLLALPQVGTHTAAQMLITGGENLDRLHSEAAFAKLVGTAPIPASSGKTTRVRLNRGGDRRANTKLHLLVLRRLASDPATKAYMARRTTEPTMDTKAVIRCLKRYAAREIYHALKADLLST